MALLRQIRMEMQMLQLWGTEQPSPQAMASTEPFAVDAMSFDDWLQWMMVPRLETMLQQGQSLPYNSNISAMAEEAFKHLSADTDELLGLVQQLDEALNLRH